AFFCFTDGLIIIRCLYEKSRLLMMKILCIYIRIKFRKRARARRTYAIWHRFRRFWHRFLAQVGTGFWHRFPELGAPVLVIWLQQLSLLQFWYKAPDSSNT